MHLIWPHGCGLHHVAEIAWKLKFIAQNWPELLNPLFNKTKMIFHIKIVELIYITPKRDPHITIWQMLMCLKIECVFRILQISMCISSSPLPWKWPNDIENTGPSKRGGCHRCCCRRRTRYPYITHTKPHQLARFARQMYICWTGGDRQYHSERIFLGNKCREAKVFSQFSTSRKCMTFSWELPPFFLASLYVYMRIWGVNDDDDDGTDISQVWRSKRRNVLKHEYLLWKQICFTLEEI